MKEGLTIIRNLVFCEECREDVEYYTVAEIPMVGTIKGTEYHYTGKEARCTCCGNQLYVQEINDANLEALYDVYHHHQKK